MEQTMGKRIMENRKRLGLTQDGLAEQLGVTAQAVSKWENDQSCPDITMLPKLAEIFGISTDELLGRTTQIVHKAEVVTEEENEKEGFHVQNGKWEFQWDGGKKNGIAFAVLVLLVGILSLFSKVLNWDVSFWSILWPSALLIFGLDGLFPKFSFFRLGCSIFGAYFLVSNLNIWELSITGELVFPIIIVLFGISLLVDALRKPNKHRFRIRRNGDTVCDQDGNSKTQIHYSTDGEHFECSTSFGDCTRLVSLPRLSGGEINCSFGELTVDLSGCEEIVEDCEIEASCSFGDLVLIVPKKFRIAPESSTAFADFSVSGYPDPNASALIRLDASVSFGAIEVKYI